MPVNFSKFKQLWNHSFFHMVIFKSNQTVFSLETALFWLPLFHTESLTTCYQFLCRSLYNGISPSSGLFQMVLETPSKEPSSESLGNSYTVFNTQTTWIGSKGNRSFFFLERKQGEGTVYKRITMFSPLFSCRFADSTGIPLPAAVALPWLPNGTHSESSKVGPHSLFKVKIIPTCMDLGTRPVGKGRIRDLQLLKF